ncbi:hypothetical protein CJI52_05835 [Bifidobacteriaceae bacterium WP022]|nr:hypothetical protein CJI52_05835 [Bifidobacteriaceae bacterium WP022]
MTTPDYYKYDDGETHFECFDISRYYSGDWAQVIQYVFRWQKKGGIEDLKKALACAKDARYSGMDSTPITKNSIFYQTIRYKFHILCNHNFSNARKVWEKFNMSSDSTYEIVDALKEMIEDAEKA